MKRFTIISLSLITAISLQARENPFVPTNAYEEEKARIIEQNQLDTQEAQAETYIKEMQQMMDNVKPDGTRPKTMVTPKVQEPKKDVITKDEVNKLIEKTKKIVQKEIAKVKETQTTKEVIFVKPRTDVEVQNKTIKPLPYLEISYNDNELSISTNYDMKKTFNLEKENKIIVDFEATKKFTTKKNSLESLNFKNLVVGNHEKKNYFRVVIKTSDKPSSYNISQENGLVTISN